MRPALIGLSETTPLTSVVVKHARDAFAGPAEIEREWRGLNFLAAPDFARALDEYEAFLDVLGRSGADVRQLPAGTAVGLDAIYARDASVVTPAGMLLCRMGKPQRAGEPAAQGEAFRDWGIPMAGVIEPPGTLEGGDVVWLDDRTMAVGRGYRTNDEGIAQLRAFVGPDIEVIVVPLPHWRGSEDVFHLMSIISPVDADLAVVYSPLMPVPFRERLLALGYTLVEVPEEEFVSMGANVLAIAPRRAIMLDGNPRTRARLERAGAEVARLLRDRNQRQRRRRPTCLTRPIARGRRPARARIPHPSPFTKGALPMVIKRISPMSCAKVSGLLYAVIGLIVGACVSLGNDDARQLHPAGGGSGGGHDQHDVRRRRHRDSADLLRACSASLAARSSRLRTT